MAINVNPPTNPVAPIPDATNNFVDVQLFEATGITGASGEYVVGDLLQREVFYTDSVVSNTVWQNLTQGTLLTVTPPAADIVQKEQTGLTDAELRAEPIKVFVTNQVVTEPASTLETVVSSYTARVDASLGFDYVEGDIIQSTAIVDTSFTPPQQQSITWKNVTQGTDNITVETADLILLPSSSLTNAELRSAPIDVNTKDYQTELYTANKTTLAYNEGDIIRRESVADFTTNTYNHEYFNVTQGTSILAGVPGADLSIASGGGAVISTETLNYVAIQDDATNSEYSVDDELQRAVQWDNSQTPPAIAGELWFNVTTGQYLSTIPLQTHYRIYTGADDTTENSVTNAATTSSGIVPSGAYQVSIANIGDADGFVQGSKLPAGYTFEFTADAGDFLEQITYDATGTEFIVTIVQSTAAGAVTPVINAPVILTPVSGTTDVSINPTITSSDFSGFGPVGSHLTTDWEIYDDAVMTNLIDSNSGGINLKSWSPSVTLSYGEDYYIRVRYNTTTGLSSNWSNLSSIITEAQPVVNAPVISAAKIGWKNHLRPIVDDGRYLYLDLDTFSANSAGGNQNNIEIEAYADAGLTTLMGTVQSMTQSEVAPADYTIEVVGQANQAATQHHRYQDNRQDLLGAGGTAYIRCRRISDNGTVSAWSNVVSTDVRYYPVMLRSTANPYRIKFTAEAIDPAGAVIFKDYQESTAVTITTPGASVDFDSSTNWVFIDGVSHFKHLVAYAAIVYQWGTRPFISAEQMFDMSPYASYNSYSDSYSTIDAFDDNPFLDAVDWPDFSQVTNADSMFRACKINSTVVQRILDSTKSNLAPVTAREIFRDCWMTVNISSLDLSNVTDLTYAFRNVDIHSPFTFSNFDTSNVTNWTGTFRQLVAWGTGNPARKQLLATIGNLDFSSAVTLDETFYDVGEDEYELSNLGNLDTSNVTTMASTFYSAYLDLDLSSWNTSNVTNMSGMFENIRVIDDSTSTNNTHLGIGNWDVSNVTAMTRMFKNASVRLNEDFSSWNTNNVTSMYEMFYQTNFTSTSGNSLVGLDTANVTDMSGMFQWAGNTSLGRVFLNIGGWDVSNVLSMSNMFYGALYNTNLSLWDVSSVVDMGNMFEEIFDEYTEPGDITNWDVSSVTNMDRMFMSHPTFNQDLSGWCVSNIPSAPTLFDDQATSWTLPRPVWGTCPP